MIWDIALLILILWTKVVGDTYTTEPYVVSSYTVSPIDSACLMALPNRTTSNYSLSFIHLFNIVSIRNTDISFPPSVFRSLAIQIYKIHREDRTRIYEVFLSGRKTGKDQSQNLAGCNVSEPFKGSLLYL